MGPEVEVSHLLPDRTPGASSSSRSRRLGGYRHLLLLGPAFHSLLQLPILFTLSLVLFLLHCPLNEAQLVLLLFSLDSLGASILANHSALYRASIIHALPLTPIGSLRAPSPFPLSLYPYHCSMLGLLFCSQDGSSRFLQDIRTHLPDFMASYSS
jgi:hypothetical protein